MSPTTIADRIRIESQILNYVREALLTAVNAPIEEHTGDQWSERCRFLTESFERHVNRLFRIKWEVDDHTLLMESDQTGLMEVLVQVESEQREMAFELRELNGESRCLAAENIANLHAFRQRVQGFMERFDDMRLRECKLWLDAYEIDIGGEG